MGKSIVSAIEKVITDSCHSIDATGMGINGTPSALAAKIGGQLPHLNDLIQALLINEETARTETLKNIDSILECKVSRETFMETVEQVLIATKEYMVGVKELAAMLKMTPVRRDTDPMPAPTTERSIRRN